MQLSVPWQFLHFHLCQHTESPTLAPTASVKLASNCLGISLELRSFCYFAHMSDRKKQEIMNRPWDIIRMVFNLHTVIFWGVRADL
jgi:hypothetical protein